MAKTVHLLTKYEQYLINNHEYRIITESQLRNTFLIDIVCRRLEIDVNKSVVTWDMEAGELYEEPINEPQASTPQQTPPVGKQPKRDKKAGLPKAKRTDKQPK